MDENRYDPLIKKYASEHRLPWLLIKSQIAIESSFNPNAQSTCGAKGLMQLMPDTDFAIDGEVDGFDPEGNIADGVRYDRWLYDHFPEIPRADERVKFMLGAYNGGKGFINKALQLARQEELGFQPLILITGKWQTWDFTCRLLKSEDCYIMSRGKRLRPKYEEIWDYIRKIGKQYDLYVSEESRPGTYPPDHTARNG